MKSNVGGNGEKDCQILSMCSFVRHFSQGIILKIGTFLKLKPGSQ